jgi:hypothetical protein
MNRILKKFIFEAEHNKVLMAVEFEYPTMERQKKIICHVDCLNMAPSKKEIHFRSRT